MFVRGIVVNYRGHPPVVYGSWEQDDEKTKRQSYGPPDNKGPRCSLCDDQRRVQRRAVDEATVPDILAAKPAGHETNGPRSNASARSARGGSMSPE